MSETNEIKSMPGPQFRQYSKDGMRAFPNPGATAFFFLFSKTPWRPEGHHARKMVLGTCVTAIFQAARLYVIGQGFWIYNSTALAQKHVREARWRVE
jgi:hypothetical protein